MKHKKQIGVFSGIYILSYLAYSLGLTQFVPYLTSLGYSPVERGILLSSIAVVTIIVQLIFGYISDKYKTVKKLYIIVLIFFAIATYLFYSLEVKYFIFHLLLIALSGGFFNLAMGMGDNWILETNDHMRQMYSAIRAFGSLGWALGSTLVAYVINLYGYYGISVTVMFITVIVLGCCLFLDDASKRYDKNINPVTKADVIELCKNKSYLLVVIILFLLTCVNTFNTYTTVDKLIFLGGSNKDVGIMWTIKGLVEIPMFFAGTLILRKFKASGILMISAVMFTIQFILFGFATSINTVIILSAMQVVTYPLLLISSKVLIDNLSSEFCKSTGQLVAMSVYNGVSALIIPYLSGVLTERVNVNFTLFFAAGLGVVAFLLTFLIKKSRRNSRLGCSGGLSIE
ncbi:MFS transporter [Clostridium sp.]|uniref:MFS transporter n=1 Tax=Clostridium sp. TaxID=1506 RepID=UPI003216F452